MRLERAIQEKTSELLVKISAKERYEVRGKLRVDEKAKEMVEVELYDLMRERESGKLLNHGDHATIVQICAWVQLLAAALYGYTEDHEDILDYLMAACAFGFLLEQLWTFHFWPAASKGGSGCLDYFRRRWDFMTATSTTPQPDQLLSRKISIVLVLGSVVGAVFLLAGGMHTPLARFLCSLTVLLTITRNEKMSKMIHTFKLAISACLPVVASLISVMLLYAFSSSDLYGDKPVDDDGKQHSHRCTR